MDDLIAASADDRKAVFRAAAEEQEMQPMQVEKDFWVCYLLRLLFRPPLVPGMVFKGGTSLSKVWHAIARFSEDIDLTVPKAEIPEARGISETESMSGSQRKNARRRLNEILFDWCRGSAIEEVFTRIHRPLDGSSASDWELVPAEGGKHDDVGPDGRDHVGTILFRYAKSLTDEEYLSEYVRPEVRLEFGLRNPVKPWEDHVVRPYCAQAGSYTMADPDVPLRVLAAERTFWEKVTLIHAENHREIPRQNANHISRHYADVATLSDGAIGTAALQDLELLRDVADTKNILFYSRSARYDEAAAGHLMLVPPKEHEAVLRRDYGEMEEMYFRKPSAFEEIIARLKDLQEKVKLRSETKD